MTIYAAESFWARWLQERVGRSVVRRLLGDLMYQRILLHALLGYWPRIKHPRTFNEKVSHRLFFTRDARFGALADKWAVRAFVADRIGSEYLPVNYGVYDRAEDIDFTVAPQKFVLKATHGAGWVRLVYDKSTADLEALRATAAYWLSHRHGRRTYEYWYADIPPRVMIEEMIDPGEFASPTDYKVWTYHGVARYVRVQQDRFHNHRRAMMDRDWNLMPFALAVPSSLKPARPERLDEMLRIAEVLARGFDFVRIDLYWTGQRIYFGEFTFAPSAGRGTVWPDTAADFHLGAGW